MGAIERNYFRTQKDGDVTTYYYNGKKVTKKKFDEERAGSKKRQKDLLESAKKGQEDLLGISKEDYFKETPAQRKKRMLKEMEDFKKGGAVKRYKGGLMVKPKRAKGGY